MLSNFQLESASLSDLARFIASPDDLVRAQSASELVRRQVGPEVGWPILTQVRADTSVLVRRQLPKGAVFFGVPVEQAVPVLQTMLQDTDPIVRSLTKWALEHYGELPPLEAEAEPDAAADGGGA